MYYTFVGVAVWCVCISHFLSLVCLMSHVDLKVVLLGKEFSGKTSLVERWLNGRFAGENKYQNTIGAAYGAKQMEHDGKIITMGVWDTAGSER